MGKNKDNKGRQQGAVNHAPSQHGDKTRRRQAEIAQSGNPIRDRAGPGHDENEVRAHNTIGKDRLFEDREQHDEAEKNSEKTRAARDMERHNHPLGDEANIDRDSIATRKS
jgi:hypothetical protein